jgi:hypothetical protein
MELCLHSLTRFHGVVFMYTRTLYLIYLATNVKVKVPRNRPGSPEGGRGIALLFLDLGARRGWVVSTTPRPLYPGKDLVPIVQEAGRKIYRIKYKSHNTIHHNYHHDIFHGLTEDGTQVPKRVQDETLAHILCKCEAWLHSDMCIWTPLSWSQRILRV